MLLKLLMQLVHAAALTLCSHALLALSNGVAVVLAVGADTVQQLSSLLALSDR
jgi:hypothetical protein